MYFTTFNKLILVGFFLMSTGLVAKKSLDISTVKSIYAKTCQKNSNGNLKSKHSDAHIHYVDGKQLGYKLKRVSRESSWYKWGFRDGDIIYLLNKLPLCGRMQTAYVFSSVRNLRSAEIIFSRNKKIALKTVQL